MNKKGLLLVDIQRDFWEPYKKLPIYEEVPENIRRLRKYAEKNRIPVLHVKSLFRKDRSDWMLFYRPEGRGRIPWIEDTTGSEFTEFSRPGLDEKVFTKQIFDAYTGTEIPVHLNELGVDNLLICGIETSVCILFTATSAYLDSILPVVVHDACADQVERHSAVLEMYKDLCFKTLSTNQVIEEESELMSIIKTYTRT